MKEYQVLARRYRPKTFQEVLGQDAIVQTLKNSLKTNRLSAAYLFSGSRGTGKTTLARIFAKALNCERNDGSYDPCGSCSSCIEIGQGSSLDVLEIDGASHRGIDDIRVITESVGYAPARGKFKIYIIDEVHMLTKEAFNALLKTLEEPPSQVKFFFATTEAHKVPDTILSRCQRFNLRRISPQIIEEKLQRIAKENGIDVSKEALDRLAQYAEGGLRDAESMFDLLISYSTTIGIQEVQDVLGILPRKWLFELDNAYKAQQYAKVFEISKELFLQGKDIGFFIKDCIDHYRHLLYYKLEHKEEIQNFDKEYNELLQSSSEIYSTEDCLAILELLTSSEQEMKTTVSQRIFLESLLLKVLRQKTLIPIDKIAMRLIELEKSLSTSQVEPVKPTTVPTAIKKEITAPVVAKKDPAKKKEAEPLSPKRELLSTLTDSQVSKATPAPIEDIQKKSRHDTLMQFAAVELEGSLQKKGSSETK